MSNQHGFVCPSCGDSDHVEICAFMWTRLFPDGTDASVPENQDVEWGDDNPAQCADCRWSGTVNDLLVLESERSPDYPAAPAPEEPSPNGATINENNRSELSAQLAEMLKR